MDNGHEPATKADLQRAIQSLKDELLEAMRDMETRLLKAFYDFARLQPEAPGGDGNPGSAGG